ncbi:MAG TPA: hypothetical protein VHF91_02200 [Acidimicrobiales bacterium]|nr:hypothetical protein [Acidimicrobiales bacterium]
MTVSRARLCVVALSVALLAGACGGADELSGAKAGFVAQIDPICAELQADLGELGANPEEQAAQVEAAVMRMTAIERPAEDSVIVDRYIASMENLYLSLQDAHQARLVNDEPRAQRAIETARINNQNAAEAAEEYGMVVCAREL